MDNQNVLIVGGGINGLTTADLLSKKGVKVTLIEKNEIGGLARSFYYDSGFTFDVGPHRLVTGNQKVIDYVKNVCGGKLLQFPNISGVYLLGKYYDWPLGLGVVLKLPFHVMFFALIDMIKLIFVSKKRLPENYQDYVLMKYGKTLHDLDFKPYTEKFTKKKVEEIDPDWAKMGINRAVANEGIKMDSLFSVVIDTLKPKKPSMAYYPEEGIAQFSSLLCQRIQKQGGQILQKTTVEFMKLDQGLITEVLLTGESEPRHFDHIVWSGDIDSVIELLLGKKGELEYIDMVLMNLEIEGEPINNYQYTYFVDENIVFNRIYSNTLFSNKVAPCGMFGMCVEITDLKNSETYENPQSLVEPTIDCLIRSGQIKDRASIKNIHIERMEAAYPLYTVGYRKLLSEYISEIEKSAANITLSGRSGLFWYNNMDHTIENAENVVADIMVGQRRQNEISIC